MTLVYSVLVIGIYSYGHILRSHIVIHTMKLYVYMYIYIHGYVCVTDSLSKVKELAGFKEAVLKTGRELYK